MSAKITALKSREILDSRGVPTIETQISLDSGHVGNFKVPSGASTGEREALELRDGDLNRYFGKGVLKACENTNLIMRENLVGQKFSSQEELDNLLINLDNTPNKSNLGANAILGVSMAYAHAQANFNHQPLYRYLNNQENLTLPTPMMNLLNGGAHANNSLDIQEFMIVPHGFDNFRESLRAGSEVFHSLKKILENSNLSTAVGDEGGFAPELESTRQALDLLIRAIKESNYEPGKQISLALDAAASEFYDSQKQLYYLADIGEGGSRDLINFYSGLCSDYPIISLEDGLDQNDWPAWQSLTAELGQDIQIVGDDLFVTNSEIFKQGIKNKSANAILIKLNQIGTLSETLEAINLAKEFNFNHVISHRSGETEDTSIADLAVATCAPYIKTGSLSRSERICKYNRLLVIEEELKN